MWPRFAALGPAVRPQVFRDPGRCRKRSRKQVSEKLRLRPTGEEQKRLAKRSTENTEAYQLYLKGRYYWNRRTAETAEGGQRILPASHRQGSGLWLAYAGLAESYALFSFYEVLPPSEVVSQSESSGHEGARDR